MSILFHSFFLVPFFLHFTASFIANYRNRCMLLIGLMASCSLFWGCLFDVCSISLDLKRKKERKQERGDVLSSLRKRLIACLPPEQLLCFAGVGNKRKRENGVRVAGHVINLVVQTWMCGSYIARKKEERWRLIFVLSFLVGRALPTTPPYPHRSFVSATQCSLSFSLSHSLNSASLFLSIFKQFIYIRLVVV